MDSIWISTVTLFLLNLRLCFISICVCVIYFFHLKHDFNLITPKCRQNSVINLFSHSNHFGLINITLEVCFELYFIAVIIA